MKTGGRNAFARGTCRVRNDPIGVEHPSKQPGNLQIRPTGGAESGALAALTLDPELARLVAAWPALSDAIRRAVLALVGTVANLK